MGFRYRAVVGLAASRARICGGNTKSTSACTSTYLDLTIKFNAFYYALAGAIASFVLSRSDLQTVRFVLILPATMAIVLAGISARGAWLNRVSRDDVVMIMQALGFDSWPELHVLSMILIVSAALFALVALGLFSVVFWPTLLPAGVLCR